MSDKTSYSTNFGATVSTILTQRSMSQTALAQAMGRSASHVNHVLTGRYSRPTATWADLVANALDLAEDQRKAIHRAAALDNGFKL